MKFSYWTEDGKITVDLASFSARSEALYRFLRENSKKVYTIEQVQKENPTLGSWDSVTKQARHLERLGLVTLKRKLRDMDWEARIQVVRSN